MVFPYEMEGMVFLSSAIAVSNSVTLLPGEQAGRRMMLRALLNVQSGCWRETRESESIERGQTVIGEGTQWVRRVLLSSRNRKDVGLFSPALSSSRTQFPVEAAVDQRHRWRRHSW